MSGDRAASATTAGAGAGVAAALAAAGHLQGLAALRLPAGMGASEPGRLEGEPEALSATLAGRGAEGSAVPAQAAPGRPVRVEGNLLPSPELPLRLARITNRCSSCLLLREGVDVENGPAESSKVLDWDVNIGALVIANRQGALRLELSVD